MRSSARALMVGAVLAAPLPGCASLGFTLHRMLPDQGRECPGPLLPTEQMRGDFSLRQSVRVQGEGLDLALTLVSQKRGSTLVLVGLDPFGAKLFTLRQRGTAVAVDRPQGRLPFPPVNLLHDLHRFVDPAAEPEKDVTVSRDADQTVRIHHAACGYDTTLVTVQEEELPSR